jgi:hypothetical protein
MILLHKKAEPRAEIERVYVRLRSGTDTGHGQTDVDGRTNTTEEELGFQEDLAVSDGNDLEEGDERAREYGRRGHTLVGM